MQDTIKVFASKMYNFRKEMKLTQEELADVLGLDNSYVSLLERGARVPSLLTLDRIAKAFKVKAADLLTEVPRGEKYSFRQKELLYIIREGSPEDVDKIYRVMKIITEKPGKKKTKPRRR